MLAAGRYPRVTGAPSRAACCLPRAAAARRRRLSTSTTTGLHGLAARLRVPAPAVQAAGKALSAARSVAVPLSAVVARAAPGLARVVPAGQMGALNAALRSQGHQLAKQWAGLHREYKWPIYGTVFTVGVLWLGRRVVSFLQRFMIKLESMAFYFAYIGTGLAALVVGFHVRGRFHLSARVAHRMAAHLVTRSSEPVLVDKLGGTISRPPTNVRIVTRSGGQWQVKWPKSETERLREHNEISAKAEAEEEAMAQREAEAAARLETELAKAGPHEAQEVALDAPPTLTSLIPAPVAKAFWRSWQAGRDRANGIRDALGIVSVKYQRQRAHLVFPMEGENGQRAMVSCEIKKDPVRRAVS